MTTEREGPVDVHLAALAAATRAAAPRPAPPAAIRILAERRLAARRARRLQRLVAAACVAPAAMLPLARVIRPEEPGTVVAVAACLVAAMLPALGAATCSWRWRT
jgi:hypothetical protein